MRHVRADHTCRLRLPPPCAPRCSGCSHPGYASLVRCGGRSNGGSDRVAGRSASTRGLARRGAGPRVAVRSVARRDCVPRLSPQPTDTRLRTCSIRQRLSNRRNRASPADVSRGRERPQISAMPGWRPAGLRASDRNRKAGRRRRPVANGNARAIERDRAASATGGALPVPPLPEGQPSIGSGIGQQPSPSRPERVERRMLQVRDRTLHRHLGQTPIQHVRHAVAFARTIAPNQHGFSRCTDRQTTRSDLMDPCARTSPPHPPNGNGRPARPPPG